MQVGGVCSSGIASTEALNRGSMVVFLANMLPYNARLIYFSLACREDEDVSCRWMEGK
jgi:hypothetical protein